MAADREFKIKITTESDPTGARQSSQAMEDVTKHTEKAEISHRALRVALRQLGPEFAEVGHTALYAFANPITAGVIGLSVAIGALIKHFEELSERAEEAAKRATEGLERIQAATEKATEEVGKADRAFDDWAKHVSDETGSMAKDLDSVLDRIKSQVELETKLAEMHGAPGGVKEAIEGRGATQSRAAIEAAIREVSTQLAAATANASTASQDAIAMRARGAGLEESIRLGKEAAAGERAKIPKGGIGDAITEVWLRSLFVTSGGRMGEQPEQREARFAGYQDAAAKHDAEVLRQKKTLEELTLERERATEAEKNAKKIVEDLSAQLTHLSQLQEKFGRGETVRSAIDTERVRQELGAMGLKPGSAIGNTLLRDIGFAEAKTSGATLTTGQQGQLDALQQAILQATGNSQAKTIQFMQLLFSTTVSHDQKINELLSLFGQLKAQQQAQHVP